MGKLSKVLGMSMGDEESPDSESYADNMGDDESEEGDTEAETLAMKMFLKATDPGTKAKAMKDFLKACGVC